MRIMGNLKLENFTLKKFKKTNSGIAAEYLERVVIDSEISVSENTTKTTKVEPHPDLIAAFNKLEDNGLTKVVYR